MSMVRTTELVKDYLEYRRDHAEHQSIDSALREIFREIDSDWEKKARNYREES